MHLPLWGKFVGVLSRPGVVTASIAAGSVISFRSVMVRSPPWRTRMTGASALPSAT